MTSHLTVVLLAQSIGLAFAIGTMLLLVLSVLPASRSVARGLWPILGSEAAILTAGVLPWLLPPVGLLALLLIAAARLGFESGTVHEITVDRDFGMRPAMLMVAMGGIAWFASTGAFLVVGVLLLGLAMIVTWLTRPQDALGSIARFVIFPLLPFAAFSHGAAQTELWPFLVLAFFLVEIFDSFSLLGGKLYGRTKLLPRLSPRKTWEGLATGVGATLLAISALVFWLDLPLLSMLVAGIVVVSSAIVGDLLGSLAKRNADVKDYPQVMRVQGGLLDIADAWLVAGPCLAGLATIAGWL